MLEGIDQNDIIDFNAQNILEPVLWSYAENLDSYLQSSTWMALKIFKFYFFIIILLIYLEIYGLRLHLKVLMVR